MVAFGIVLLALDERMRDAGGPGIVGFELAGTGERAHEILADWGDSGRDAARLSLWLDFPYLLAYGAFWALAVTATRDAFRVRGSLRLARPGALVAFPLGAAAFDAVEDVALLLVLGERGGSALPALATACASAKFLLIAIAVLYVIAGLVARGAAAIRAR